MVVCAPVVGLRLPSCCRSPLSSHRLSPPGPLLHTCSRCQSIAVDSSPPLLQYKMLLPACGTDLETKRIAQGEPTPSLRRLSTLSLPPPASSNPGVYGSPSTGVRGGPQEANNAKSALKYARTSRDNVCFHTQTSFFTTTAKTRMYLHHLSHLGRERVPTQV